MKKFILAIAKGIVTSIVEILMYVTPKRTQIHVFERFIVALHADRRFRQTVHNYTFDKLRYKLGLSEETPEVPVFVRLYNAFVFAHDTLAAATPHRPNEKRSTFEEIRTS